MSYGMGYGFGLTSLRGRPNLNALIARLFRNAEPGALFDASDLTSMYQGRTGTTAAAVGSPVGQVLDKSGNGAHAVAPSDAARPVLGRVPKTGRRNLLTFTEQFDNAAWVKTNATVTANATTAPDGTLTADKIAEDSSTANHFAAQLFSFTGPQTHTFTCYLKASERTVGYLRMGTAAFGADRFAYFDLAAGTVGTTAASTTASITAAGDGWYRCAITATSISGSLTAGYTVAPAQADNVLSYAGTTGHGILIWGAQLETGSTATNYQRVVTAFDVTEASVRDCYYLQGNGVNTALVTGTITPNTDKVQVVAGIRKESDAAVGIFAELSVEVGANAGSFAFGFPGNIGQPDVVFRSRGSVSAAAFTATGIAAPATRVLTATSDISADSAIIRANATQVAQSTADQGTGNFLAYPLYIGARAGTSLFFNGKIFRIGVRFGPNLDATQIAQFEKWAAFNTPEVTL
jgi:hypothetical protein